MTAVVGLLPATGRSIADLARLAPRIEPAAHLAAAAYLLDRSGDTALLVAEEGTGRLETVITASDISRAVAHGRDPEETRVSDIVQRHPGTADAALPADEAARTMLSAGSAHLLVRSDDRVVGVVGLADVCGWLLSLLTTNPSLGGAGDPSASDGPPAPPEPARAG
jgi:CBS domain-containing protein